MRNLIILPVLLLLIACDGLQPRSPQVFYNVDSLVNAQISYLTKRQPEVVKSGIVKEDSVYETTITPDSLQWTRELAIFKRADINKPRLREKYEAGENLLENGDREISYSALSEKNLPVRYLSIRFGKGDSQLKEINATISDDNPIYKSERRVRMKFESEKGASRLISYYIEGGQKMKLRDTVRFDLSAIVRYD